MAKNRFNAGSAFGYAVSAGFIKSVRRENILAFRDSMAPSTVEDITSLTASTYTFPSDSGEAMEVVSSNAGDASTVTVVGLDSDFLEVSESVALNGTTPVALTQYFSRVNQAFCAGPDPFVGTVNVQGSGGATVFASINPAAQRANQGVYTCPAGQRVFVTAFGASVRRPTGVEVQADARLLVRESGGVFQRHEFFGLQRSGSTNTWRRFDFPPDFHGPCDIKVAGQISAESGSMTAGLTLLLFGK